MSYEPRTRLEKILCGVSGAAEAARTRIEKAVAVAMTSIASAVELPVVTDADDGLLLGVVMGKWSKVATPSVVPYELEGTLNGETGAMTLANITASALYDVSAEGKTVKITIDLGGSEIAIICGMTAQKASGNYDFAMIASTGTAYTTGHLAADDSVVLSPVSTE